MTREYIDMDRLESDSKELHSFITNELEITTIEGINMLLQHYRNSLAPKEDGNSDETADLDYYG